MIHNYNDLNCTDLSKIEPEFVYLTIPTEYVCTYHKLLVYLTDFGKELIDDCSSSCKNQNKLIVDCWNLFQSAIACRTLGKTKEAEFFINYINKQLEKIYKGTDKKVYDSVAYLPISEDGFLKAIVSCKDTDVEFYVDEITGELYEKYLNNKDNFHICNNNLILNK